MGLAICKSIVEMMQGKIDVVSERAKGCIQFYRNLQQNKGDFGETRLRISTGRKHKRQSKNTAG